MSSVDASESLKTSISQINSQISQILKQAEKMKELHAQGQQVGISNDQGLVSNTGSNGPINEFQNVFQNGPHIINKQIQSI